MQNKNMLKIILTAIIVPMLYSLLHLSPFNNYIFTSIVKILLFVGTPLILRHNFKNVLTKAPNKKAMAFFAVSALVITVIIIGGYNLFKSQFDQNMILGALKNQGITGSNFIFVFINIIFINAFTEELFFRGYIFFSLRETNKKTAYIISSVIFALYHVTMLSGWFNPFIFILCMAGLFVGGLIFCYADEKCSNIWGGYFLHAGANLGINLIGLYFFLNV